MAVSVGRSHRTPAKHALMCTIIGREVSAARFLPQIDQLVWLDLTAGDGVIESESLSWEKNCSPGIVAYYAKDSAKPITVKLHELKAATFDRLERNLADHLPMLGYEFTDGWWRCGNARLCALNSSGAEASLDGVNTRTAVLVSNDPNAITDWAMRPEFAAEIRERTRWFRAISTMGCNIGGLKRLERADREKWFHLINQQRNGILSNHDLLLAAIERDDAQWAYLIHEAAEWRQKAETAVNSAFGRHGMSMDCAWARKQPVGFGDLQRRLFLTRKELSA